MSEEGYEDLVSSNYMKQYFKLQAALRCMLKELSEYTEVHGDETKVVQIEMKIRELLEG